MLEKTISINRDNCRKDGLCARICPMKIFQFEEGEYPRIEHMEHCVLCGQCLAVCPHDAIEHSVLAKENLTRIKKQMPVDDELLAEFLRSRRSVRVYKKKEIPEDTLTDIARICGYSPTGAHGGDGWVRNVIIVTGKDNLRLVLGYTVEYMRKIKGLLENPVVKVFSRWSPELRGGIITVPDIEMRLKEYEKGNDIILYDAQALIFVHAPKDTCTPQIDCDAALYAMMLLAHARGLGTCWMGWVQKAADGFKMRSFKKLKQFLGVPEGHGVYAAMAIGYPAIKLHSLPPREVSIAYINEGCNETQGTGK